MPAAADFVHLHVHSEFSLLDGANRIGPMLDHVKSLGQPAVALTDHGVLFGALEFYHKATEKGVKPIVGCEVYITSRSRRDRGPGEQKNTHHLLLLAENYEGYRNLCKLSSIGHTEGFYYKPRIDWETLQAHKSGLIATSSCLAGLIPQALLDGDEKKAAQYTGQFVDLFGRERFFMELMDHGIKEQKLTNPYIIDIAKKQKLRLIATNDCHYMTRGDAEMHDVLLCVQTGARVSDKERFRFDCQEFYVKSTDEMAHLFRDLPDAITNTRHVADMCSLQMPKREYHLPKFPCPDGKTENDYLRELVLRGMEHRYGGRAETDRALRDRMEFELGVIIKMGFASYFLIVSDFIAHARSQGIPVGPGRGSAAGSVVAYALQITQLCPLEHGLLFERFLNPDRLSMPDIDIDFCFERRGEVIEYVRQKYGEDCVSSIITFGTMKAKAAVRDVGRAMDIPLATVDKVAKAIPFDLKMTLAKAKAESQDLRDLMERDPQIAKLIDMAAKVEGMVRHASTHAAGIIISDKPLTEYCPLYKSPNEDKPATQFTMTEVEEHLGLLKMDFLGLKNLTIIERVVKWVREREGVEVDWTKIPFDDSKTYEVLQHGHTLGVFQLESAGMTALVKRLKPTEFADLTALLAMYRPGPLEAGMHDMYVRRKHGQEKVKYDHPCLEPLLKETYGVILYQEQVMRISLELCGFTPGESDVLRKAMGKKKADVMAKMESQFVAGAEKKHGVDRQLSKSIWDNIVTFAGYGFNKSHSAAYAVVTFQTAYLRAHYPTYFHAALLTNEIDGGSTDAIAKYIPSCRDAGLEVLPVNVNTSREYFNPDGHKIWYAINAVKGVGTGFAQAIVRERAAHGPFKGLQDFCMRIPREEMNSRMVEALIKVGGFDSMESNRAALLAALPRMMDLAVDLQRQKDSGQDDLFNAGGEEEGDGLVQNIPLPPMPELDLKDRAAFEKEFLGFYLSDHPLKRFQVEMESFGEVRSSDLPRIQEEIEAGVREERVPATAMGYIADIVRKVDKNGAPWGIVVLEDLDGQFECKFFSRSFGTYAEDLKLDTVVQVGGTISIWNGRLSFDGQTVRRADELRAQARGLIVEWPTERFSSQLMIQLAETCRRFGGTRQVLVAQSHPKAGQMLHKTSIRVDPTPAAIEALQKLPGSPRLRFQVPKETLAPPKRNFKAWEA